ncbi:MAG: TIGR04255 family protein [Pseudomonadota bacterium]|nr:TIGR04255 family protein [Gammaproteobacteria bacterium]MDQ3583851.1 TIGR04255 family protein [Pseudomonadota bacterium]
MARQRHLDHAPIREAIIDFRVSPNVEVSALRRLGERLKADFPVANELRMRTFGFEVTENQFRTSTVDQGAMGVRLVSKDNLHVVQFKADGLTLSRLAPYDSWEAMNAKARELWKLYLEASKPERVTRLATRYINVMELALPIPDFRDFLVCPPEVPPALPQEISSFFFRIVIPERESQSAAILTQALEGVIEGTAPVVLDIDAFNDEDLPAASEDVWETLEVLREFKNRIFFESITEKTAELFE